MGGGFSRLFQVRPTFDFSVAAKLLVPWVQTNERHTLILELRDSDGNVVRVGEEGREVRVEGQIEVGRPPGLPQGTEIDLPLVWRMEDLPLLAGRYRWELTCGGDHVADATLDVVPT
ncbi:DUF6941 family protein [Microbacterium sp. CH-015]|uniref:DUF6941 family protein n=1 Tax=Microbacterium TaxID=33882 RepID=UPI003C735896